MHAQSPTISLATDQTHSLTGRVLSLRQQLGIAIPFSMSYPEEICSSPEAYGRSTATHNDTPYTASKRDWLTWSQSPNDGRQPGQDEKELL
jgi:hypothetical protein